MMAPVRSHESLKLEMSGPGQPRIIQELVQAYNPRIIFLSDTRQCKEKVKGIKWKLGLKHYLTHDGKGKCVWIALFWDEQIFIKLLSYGRRHFDVIVQDDSHGPKWWGTFVYGDPRVQDRNLMWSLLRRIKPDASEPWLMIGDFNERTWLSEHFSYV